MPSSRKRFLKISLFIVAFLVFSILGLHIWFVNNARTVLKQFIATESKGKLKLELSQLRLDFLSNKLQIRQADLMNTDSLSQPITYHIRFRKLTLRLSSFWPLLLEKKILLDSIKLHDPDIRIMQWRKNPAPVFNNELSIPKQMGTLYNSMLDALDNFGIRRIIINNASISLINKMVPDAEPVTITNIYFDLLRTAKNPGKRDAFVSNEQSVDLETTHQNIALPGGRHRLSFKSFNLHLFQKRIELDSCTVTAIATDSTKSSFKIYFSKLLLIGVDFNAMYVHNLIRADSVYCENPLFDININTSVAGSKKQERPDPEKIVRELTGDLELAFIGAKNAGIHIDINGEKKRSIFNTNKDNFEIRGLRINADSSRPVVVQRFDMLVRDYRLYNEDSSSAFGFDSIRFMNNKIILNNFSVATNSNNKKIRDQRDFRIPYFELTQLDWYQLIFEQNLHAQEASLYNPVIHFVKKAPAVSRKKINLFAALQSLDSLLTLRKINVYNGQIDMKLGPATSLNLQNVDLGLYSNQLLRSTDEEGLRGAVDRLSFSKGLIRLNDITAQLDNAQYTGRNLVSAGKLSITSRSDNINATINNVRINNILLNEDAEMIEVDGLQWADASVSLRALGGGKSNGNGGSFLLKNIAGNNTQVRFSNGKTAVSTFVQSVKAAAISKTGNRPVQVNGFFISGTNLSANAGPMRVKAAGYQIANNDPSFIEDLDIRRYQPKDSLHLRSPRINFTADINGILSNNIHLTQAQVLSPFIKMSKWTTETAANPDALESSIRIDQITATNPVIQIAMYNSDSATVINVPPSGNSLIKASGVMINKEGMRVGRLQVNTTAATLVKANGETLGVEKGKVELELSDTYFGKKDGEPQWGTTIDKLSLQNPNQFVLGKNKNTLLLQQASVGNLRLSSEYITNFDQLLKANISAWLRTTTGQYTDSKMKLNWYNAEYNYKDRTLSLDSFAYHPTQPRDSVMAHTPYQTDYVTFRSGAVKFTDFDLEKYEKDSALIAQDINVTNPVITVYRDKLPPFLAGIIKPLPVDMIKKISLPVSVGRINIDDGMLTYTERNAKTRAEATLNLTRINGSLRNIKNRDLAADDSLGLTLNGYLVDSAWIRLRVKESYTDSLSGFLMTLQMRPTTLTFLNPVLIPLSNVKIASGTIDSLRLRAIGRDDIALGEMHMYYHNLRIKLIKKGDPDKSSFANDVLSFLANTLFIRKNNTKRIGLVYFERHRDRSFFNYIVKMTFSGMATSIGVISNRKYIRKYKKELREENLPPIDF